MSPRRQETEITESIAIQHRIALGLTSLTLAALGFSLAVALLAAPGSFSDKLFSGSQSTAVSIASTANSITLTWTAPGDDGTVGQAAAYDIRYATTPITADGFQSATAVTDAPAPQVAGSTETYTVNGLQPDTTYYFALKTRDVAGNVSDISNVVSKTTAALAVACTPVYDCSAWSACANSKMTRTCRVTNACATGLGEPPLEQACTGGVGGEVQITNPFVVAGAGVGAQPKVRILKNTNLTLKKEFLAYTASNHKGVFVAAGDVDGNGTAEAIVGTGPGSQSAVRIYSALGKLITTAYPFGSKSTTGVTVAAGDVNGDGHDDIIMGPASGKGTVRVYTFNTTSHSLQPLVDVPNPSSSYSGGYNVAVADLNLDGKADVLLARRVNGNGVTAYAWNNGVLQKSLAFSAYPITFRSGITIATGDINGDGYQEILTVAGAGYWGDVKVFSSTGVFIGHFIPFRTSFYGGVTMTVEDMNSDGVGEMIIAPASSAAPTVKIFRYDPATRLIKQTGSKGIFPAAMHSGLRLGGI